MINDYYGKNDLNIDKNKINNDDKIAIKNQNSKKNIK